ncbi:hypothetical protein DSM3645_18151 [Blastopirellula marina DSM 3645]|uniref:Uncharacterized protein n=1 Tax=Blastopirellula marina DSM 3645 TaxID=314230 RepID=A3ZYS4_9BACT|nr:hypothetical protein DSM3645_18151 [Blastopirellula marina DSM 3645]
MMRTRCERCPMDWRSANKALARVDSSPGMDDAVKKQQRPR